MGPLSHLCAWLSEAADRPDTGPSIAAVVVVAIVILALVVLFSGRDEPASRPQAPVAAPGSTTAPVPAEHAAPTSGLSEQQRRDARRAARRFLRDYLAFTHGRLLIRDIDAATDDLLVALTQQGKPRVPAAVRRQQPRIRRLQNGEGSTTESVPLTAVVDDGDVTYSVHVLVTAADGQWLVAAVR